MTTPNRNAEQDSGEHADHDAILEILWTRDINAFVDHDWSRVEPTFDRTAFCGYAHGAQGTWTVAYANLDSYRDDWLRQADSFTGADQEALVASLRRVTRITALDINGDRAVARKEFEGTVETPSGAAALAWVTFYFLRRNNTAAAASWLITGFVGGLPLPGRDAPSML